jgi:hypothetical protein
MLMNDTALRQSYQNQKRFKLLLSVMLDLVGMSTFLIPGLGELGDLIWAPIAGMAGLVMYGGVIGAAGGAFTFMEEILPGTDIIPGLTFTWIFKYVIRDRQSFARYARKHGSPELPPLQST